MSATLKSNLAELLDGLDRRAKESEATALGLADDPTTGNLFEGQRAAYAAALGMVRLALEPEPVLF